ncbi:MAG: AEC family transporter [Lachnospiraceae bacterium]|nr:AEC family transporter [Lachnospiraceae bacterium]
MTIALVIAKQLLIMFIYMMIGYLLYRSHKVSDEGSRSLANLLLYVVLPASLIRPFIAERTPDKAAGLIISFIAAAVILAVSMLIAAAFFRKNAIDNFGAAFSNAGFMGIPLITAALGSDAVFYAAGFIALLNILQWTYGQALISGDRSMIQPGAILKNPVLIAVAAGLVIFFAGIPLPAVVSSAIGALAGMNGPLAMVILGIYLAQTRIGEMFSEGHLYFVSAVRLLVIPLITILIVLLIPRQYSLIRSVLIIVNAAPIGSNVAVYAQKQGKDHTYAVKIVCLSTILSIVTMSLIMALASVMGVI